MFGDAHLYINDIVKRMCDMPAAQSAFMIATLYLRIERRQRVKMGNAGTRQVGNIRSSDVIEAKITEPKLEIRLFLMMGLAGAYKRLNFGVYSVLIVQSLHPARRPKAVGRASRAHKSS